MVYFSPATKEITAKIVYYGPGMCGKTTNLQKVHELMRPQMKTELVSVATETDRTIYFDFLPVKLGKIAGFDFVVRSFTVPGQPYYAETRKMVLVKYKPYGYSIVDELFFVEVVSKNCIGVYSTKRSDSDTRTIHFIDIKDIISIQELVVKEAVK